MVEETKKLSLIANIKENAILVDNFVKRKENYVQNHLNQSWIVGKEKEKLNQTTYKKGT